MQKIESFACKVSMFEIVKCIPSSKNLNAKVGHEIDMYINLNLLYGLSKTKFIMRLVGTSLGGLCLLLESVKDVSRYGRLTHTDFR